ncbi:hypothetical protein [Limnoglobus roseus]|nr:hypothetical protein [Limnoglobus roseus]
MIVQAVRPVLNSEEFARSVRGIFAEFTASAEFHEVFAAHARTVFAGFVTSPEFHAGLASAVPFDAIVKAVQHANWSATRDPVMMAAETLSIGARVDKGTQILLAEKYKELLRTKAPLPRFDEVGFRTFSQFDEDGILLYIFSLIGTTNRRAVEACAGVGFECNAANLIVNHGWDGMLIDGSADNCRVSTQFYTSRSDTQISPPKIIHTWIEPDTIDWAITVNGFKGEIDLLTIDLDGIDYWIWKNITSISPRVVVVEYQPWWKADEPYTVKNIPGYWYPNFAETKPAYVGCSLGAYVKLAREKGYRLVGCNRNQLNAFFVRNDIAPDILPEVSAESCLTSRRVTESRDHYRPHVEAQRAAGDWHLA